MTGNTQLLLAACTPLKQGDDRTWAVMDAGVNHAECVRNEYHQLFHVALPDAEAARTYTVVGPICTPGDTLYHAMRLPELRWATRWPSWTRARTSCPSPRPSPSRSRPSSALDGGQERLLRRAETFDDLVTFFDAPPARARRGPQRLKTIIRRKARGWRAEP